MIFGLLNSNKSIKGNGLYSLLIAFLLLFSISGKSISVVQTGVPSIKERITKTTGKEAKYNSLLIDLEDNEDLAELDFDDVEDSLFTENFQNYTLPLEIKAKEFIHNSFVFKKTYKQPFYILYCNWKFDLV